MTDSLRLLKVKNTSWKIKQQINYIKHKKSFRSITEMNIQMKTVISHEILHHKNI